MDVAPAATAAYDLSSWSEPHRDALTARLGERQIPYQWRDATLLVPGDRRLDADALVAHLMGAAPVAPARPAPPPGAPGWRHRTDGPGGFDWWDGTAWAAHGGHPPPPDRATPPGWYDDPWHERDRRWWSGAAWTSYVDDADAARPWLPTRGPGDETAIGGLGLVVGGIVSAEVLALALALALSFVGVHRYTLAREIVPQLGLWAGLFGACVLAVRRHGGGSLRELGLRPIGRRDVPVGLLGGWIGRTAAGLIGVAFLPFLPHTLQSSRGITSQLQGRTLTIVVTGLIVVVGAPFFEELFFRGLTQSAFTHRYGARVGLFAQAACFAVVHYQVGMGVAEVLLTFAAIGSTGIVLGVLRAHYRRLGPGMVTHATFNLVAVLAALAIATAAAPR